MAYLLQKERPLKNKYEIIQLLEAIWLPAELVIIHWPGHQKHRNPRLKVIITADWVAKEVALRDLCLQTISELSTVPQLPLHLNEDVPNYDPEDLKSY